MGCDYLSLDWDFRDSSGKLDSGGTISVLHLPLGLMYIPILMNSLHKMPYRNRFIFRFSKVIRKGGSNELRENHEAGVGDTGIFFNTEGD